MLLNVGMMPILITFGAFRKKDLKNWKSQKE